MQSKAKTVHDIDEFEPNIAGISQSAEAGSSGFMRISSRFETSFAITSMKNIDEVLLVIRAHSNYATMQYGEDDEMSDCSPDVSSYAEFLTMTCDTNLSLPILLKVITAHKPLY